MNVTNLERAGFAVTTTLDGHRITLPAAPHSGGFLQVFLLFLYSADLAGLLLLTAALQLERSVQGRTEEAELDLTLRQGVLHTASGSVALEDIQRITLYTEHPTTTLRLLTAHAEHELATHTSREALTALATQLRRLSGAARRSLHARGGDPRQAAEIPKALEAMTRRIMAPR